MAKQQEFKIINHFPETEEGKAELARRVSIIQAQAILTKINKLPIPTDQKLQLLDDIIDHEREAYNIPKPKAKPKRSREMER